MTRLHLAISSFSPIFITRKLAKNFLGDKSQRSVFSNCSSLTWPMVDELGNAYRTKKSMPLNICGQGLVVRRRVLEEIGGWPYRTMTEDYELKLDSLVRGYTSMYYPHAVLYTEEAVRHSESFSRRVRWLTGYRQCDRKYKKEIRQRVRKNHHVGRGEAEYFWGLLPYIIFLLGTVVSVFAGIGFGVFYATHASNLWATALLRLTLMPMLVLYLLLNLFGLLAMAATRDAYRTISMHERILLLLYNPFYILEYLIVYFYCTLHRHRTPEWKQTERNVR